MKLKHPLNTYSEKPTPCNLTREEIEQYAEGIAQGLGYKPGNSLVDCLEKIGGQVEYQEINDWINSPDNGSIYIHGRWDFDIVLPQYTSPRRDRFTIAHELGHYFLHSNQGEHRLIAKRQGTGRAEQEANCFAAAFLMPKKEFLEAFQKLNGDLITLSVQFGVSLQAATLRQEILSSERK